MKVITLRLNTNKKSYNDNLNVISLIYKAEVIAINKSFAPLIDLLSAVDFNHIFFRLQLFEHATWWKGKSSPFQQLYCDSSPFLHLHHQCLTRPEDPEREVLVRLIGRLSHDTQTQAAPQTAPGRRHPARQGEGVWEQVGAHPRGPDEDGHAPWEAEDAQEDPEGAAAGGGHTRDWPDWPLGLGQTSPW